MKTVLHLIETRGTGGAETMLARMIEHLPSDRFRSIVGLLGGGMLDSTLRAHGVETVLFPMRHMVDLAWIRHTGRLVREREVALIHAHEFTMNAYGALMARRTGVPCVATVHGRNYYGDRFRRRLAYRVASRWATMIAVSEEIRQLLIDRIGVRPDRVRTIHNGVPLAQFQVAPEIARTWRVKLRAEWGVGENTPVVGTIGRLDLPKGQEYLVEAAALVCRSRPDALFVIAGDGPTQDALEAQIRNRGLGERVRMLGFREDIAGILRALDIFVLPSLSEGLPLAILEAMAAGVPSVATAVGGTPEVVRDGETGILVPPRDPAALAAGILRLLADPEARARLVAGATRRVAEHFDFRQTLAHYVELYDRLIGERALGTGAPADATLTPDFGAGPRGERRSGSGQNGHF